MKENILSGRALIEVIKVITIFLNELRVSLLAQSCSLVMDSLSFLKFLRLLFFIIFVCSRVIDLVKLLSAMINSFCNVRDLLKLLRTLHKL